MVQSARQYDAERDDTFRHIRRLFVQARALESQIELLKKHIIRDAESTLKLVFARYEVSKADIQDVIDNFTRLLDFHIQLVRLQANLGQTLASLERAVGCRLVTLAETTSARPKVVPPAPADSKPSSEKKSKLIPKNTEKKP